MTSSPGAGTGPFRRILAATDGSKDALRATKVAIALAKRHGAELIIVSAVPFAVGVGGDEPDALGGARALTEFHQFARAEAGQVLKRATALAREEGVPARGVVLDRATSAVEMITTFAKAERVDLIVSGTRGHSGFKKLLLGSVSGALVIHAPCSVLVVR